MVSFEKLVAGFFQEKEWGTPYHILAWFKTVHRQRNGNKRTRYPDRMAIAYVARGMKCPKRKIGHGHGITVYFRPGTSEKKIEKILDGIKCR